MKSLLIQVVNDIPLGRVASYGAVASEMMRRDEQCVTSGWLVGRLLSSMPGHEWDSLPRWRVVNREGQISALKLGHKGIIQTQLLRDEGVEVEEGYVQDFARRSRKSNG